MTNDADDEFFIAELDFNRRSCRFSDGEVGEITVMIDRDGYPTELQRECFMLIAAHPEGGYVEVDLTDTQRHPDILN